MFGRSVRTSDITIGSSPWPTSSVGTVAAPLANGGGSVNVIGGIATFGCIVQRQAADNSINGQLQYFNHASGAKVRSVTIDSFTIVGNTATFGGACTVNGAPCTFTVNVSDNGEAGSTDTFTITVSGGPTEGGPLRGGNIRISQ